MSGIRLERRTDLLWGCELVNTKEIQLVKAMGFSSV